MNRKMKNSPDGYFSTTIEKGLKLLSLFSDVRPNISQVDISKELGINHTSAFRYVSTLVQIGYLKKDPQTKRLSPSLKSIVLCNNLIRSFDFLGSIRSLVDEVFQNINQTIGVALINEDKLSVIYRREAEETFIYKLPTVHTEWNILAIGKAYMSNLPYEELKQVIEKLPMERKTTKSIVSRKKLLEEIKKTKKRGYAIANEEYTEGLLAIGAPLIYEEKHCVGAVSIDFSTIKHTIDQIEREYADEIINLANAISEIIPINLTY